MQTTVFSNVSKHTSSLFSQFRNSDQEQRARVENGARRASISTEWDHHPQNGTSCTEWGPHSGHTERLCSFPYEKHIYQVSIQFIQSEVTGCIYSAMSRTWITGSWIQSIKNSVLQFWLHDLTRGPGNTVASGLPEVHWKVPQRRLKSPQN